MSDAVPASATSTAPDSVTARDSVTAPDSVTARDIAAAHLAAIVASSADAILSKNLNGIIISWNAGAERMFGYSSEEIVGQPITRLIPLEIIEEEERILSQLRAGKRIEHYETVRLTKDGRRLNVSLTISPVHDATGRVIAASKIIRDISDRKRAEEQITLLMREVNHRAGNMLSIVQAVIRQTAKGADPVTYAADLTDRIAGLAASQSQLVQSEWRGVEVGTLVRSQVALFGDVEGDRVVLEGPELLLSPSAAQTIGMTLLELASNARKHGALSNASGRVLVGWWIETTPASAFAMTWREEGGPPVVPPSRAGFGQKLIVNMTESALRGHVTLEFDPAGVLWTLRAPTAATIAARPGGTDTMPA